MPWFFMLAACELFRGPWGAWVLYGDGETQPLASTERPVLVDASHGPVTRMEADAVMDGLGLERHGGVVVQGQALLMSWDRTTETAALYDLDGQLVHAVHDVALGDPGLTDSVSEVYMAHGLGVDPSGGLVLVHGIADPAPEQAAVRVHRWQGDGWSWRDVPLAEGARYRTDERQVTAWQDAGGVGRQFRGHRPAGRGAGLPAGQLRHPAGAVRRHGPAWSQGRRALRRSSWSTRTVSCPAAPSARTARWGSPE